MKQIINSILDDDLYKFSMMNFYIDHFPEAEATYTFNNRNQKMRFNTAAVEEIKRQIFLMQTLKLTDAEHDWMKSNLPFLPASFRQYLAAYRFNPAQVNVGLTEGGQLTVSIKGKIRDTVLWEVPLMAIISEVYFLIMDGDWSMEGQDVLAFKKAKELNEAGCDFTDFGTRRRRNFETQDIVVKTMSAFKGFMGTSNCFLAMKYGVKALGTCAHEAIGAVAAMVSLNHPNAAFMDLWSDTYKGDLGTMLPDTYGIDSFLGDFTLKRAKLWDGVRHDSGDPFVFTDKILKHYESLKINPVSKLIVFSNALDVDAAIGLHTYCSDKIRCSFGIGTHFTSDFRKASNPLEKSEPMNMVIKLTCVDDVPVVKLSDDKGKVIGDPNMVMVMEYIHFKK